MTYDVLIVGAGITACTIAAWLRKNKPTHRVCVLDTRSHAGGNCFDYEIGGTRVQAYGPHIFHSPDPVVTAFLSQFTTWAPYEHRVEAEADIDGRRVVVPFPYSQETETVLGRALSSVEIVDTFFRPYTEKMWGMPYDFVPESIKARVPKGLGPRSVYFPGQFQGLPEAGYTAMLTEMLRGVDLRLGVARDTWKTIPAKQVIYCGRLDLVDDDLSQLEWRSVDFLWDLETSGLGAPVRNFCHRGTPRTRVTDMRALTPNGCGRNLYVAETPRRAWGDELTPFYPVGTTENLQAAAVLTAKVKLRYPGMILAGRLGRYAYFDMHAACAAALQIAETL